jgi:hypothetical protein
MAGYIGSKAVILSTTGADISGNVVLSGTVDGRDVSVDGTKLDGIDTAAKDDQTAAEILTAVKTVDGAASGLDADLLDGQHGAYYTAYADTAVTNLVDNSPAALNTLNELAAALGDDASFSTTVTNSIAAKLPLAGGTMTGNIAHAGNFTLDVGGDIILDAAGEDIFFKANGTTFGQITTSSGDFHILQPTSDKDILFRGLDGSTYINALTLDMSDAGTAIFNHDAQFPDGAQVRLGADNDMKLHLDGTTAIFGAQNGNMLLDSAADIILDAAGSDIKLKVAGTEFGQIYKESGGNLAIYSSISDKDIRFQGLDGSSVVTALTLDMSEAGAATFNSHATIGGNLGVNKAVTSSVALSVGSDAATTTSYGLEVCNNNSNTRFLVDGLGNSTFYGSDNSVTAKFTSAGSLSINGAAGSDKLHIKSGFVRIQAQEQTSGSHNQRYGVRWTQETDVEVARIEVERPAWGGAPSKMNFYTRTPANSVNETMTIDEYGRVGMPNQAWASVSSSTATTSSNYVPLNANAVANGGVTVGSTNRITVPVTGNYLVGFHMLSDDQSSTFVKTRKNGSDIPGMNGQNQTDTYDNFSIQNIVNLAANDYIQFFVAGGKVHGNPSYNRMYVYKLG